MVNGEALRFIQRLPCYEPESAIRKEESYVVILPKETTICYMNYLWNFIESGVGGSCCRMMDAVTLAPSWRGA